jgi:hypothetical protein
LPNELALIFDGVRTVSFEFQPCLILLYWKVVISSGDDAEPELPDELGVGVGVGVGVGTAVTDGVGVGTTVCDGVGVGAEDCDGLGVGSGALDCVGLGVGVGAGVDDEPETIQHCLKTFGAGAVLKGA